jgi:conjugal transfer pilus assembly protein TraW
MVLQPKLEHSSRHPQPSTTAGGGKGHRGESIATHPLSRDLIFFNGHDAGQVAWAQKYPQAIWVLTEGAPLALAKAHKRQVFMDQQGRLVKKFGLQHVPARIHQVEERLAIHEVLIDD